MGLEKIDFRVEGGFRLETLKGEVLHDSKGSDLRWRARVLEGSEALFSSSVLVDSFHSREDALALARTLQAQGWPCWIRHDGVHLQVDETLHQGSSRYRVLVGRYGDPAEARRVQELLNNDYRPRLVRERVEDPKGRVEYMDADLKEHRELPDGLRLVPHEDAGLVTLFSLPTVKGDLDEFLRDRSFNGVLEFRVDNGGMLCVVNEVHLDTYLKGVLPAELDRDFPLECQKAQAIAARSNVLCMLGLKHAYDPFDFCAFGHCQQYSGRTDPSEHSDRAVEETAGQVMVWKDRVVDGVTTACCGGYGESKENVWNTPPEEMLSGQLDMSESSQRRHQPDLSNPAEFEQWIRKPLKTYCNLQLSGIRGLDDRARRYYRWQEELSRQELEEIIHRKTGVDVGTLYEIVPLQRGRSGRLMEIELIGSRRNLRLQKELKIREALSPTALFSSAFLIEKIAGDRGVPHAFRFIGAGRGHGVGLCQLGAAGMALRGKHCPEILKHYFPGMRIQVFYQG